MSYQLPTSLIERGRMALTRPRVQGARTQGETLGPRPHPEGGEPRSPRVVALPTRQGGKLDERPSDVPASPTRDAARGGPGDRTPGAHHACEAGVSDGPLHRTNVLPMPDRRSSAPRWAAPAAGGARRAALDDLAPEADAAEDDFEAATDDADGLLGADEDLDGDLGADLPGAAAHTQARSAAAPAGDPADDATMAAWIARIARQDERALEALYDATAARVNGLVLRITQRAALAEEVLEDTYWQVWRQAPRFDAQRGRPITWLLAMARSRAIDALRREHRFQHDALPEDDSADAADLSDAQALPPHDLLEATRGHAHVHAALASLEPRSRQLVALAFFRGLTHEEIATQQGMPLGTVKSLIRRALQQLKRVMEAEHA